MKEILAINRKTFSSKRKINVKNFDAIAIMVPPSINKVFYERVIRNIGTRNSYTFNFFFLLKKQILQ